MKKVLLLQSRIAEDEKTKERILFVTFASLATKNNNGQLWFPKKDELTIVSCFGEDRAPELFKRFRLALPGALCGITFGVNDYTGKTFVSDAKILKMPYSETDIYARIDDNSPTANDDDE